MSKKGGQKTRKRFRPSYFYSILMVALVLFLLGIMGLGVILGGDTVSGVKENFEIRIILKKDMEASAIDLLHKQVNSRVYVKSSKYIDEEEAIRRYKEWYDESPMEVLDENILPAEIDIHLFAPYVNEDSISKIRVEISAWKGVEGLTYDDQVVNNLNKAIKIAFGAVAALFFLLLLIAISLIDSTIRLSMYSSRFLIKSQQLIGATRGFIIRPYLQRGVLNGLISGMIGISLLICLYLLIEELTGYELSRTGMIELGGIFIGLILIGVVISTWSTYKSVLKYLKMRLDDLY